VTADSPVAVLRIESVAYRGAGVARLGGIVHFVPGTCPGELVEARIVSERRNFREARLARVLEPSPDRLADPECVGVPGCVYGHASFEVETRWKQRQLLEFLSRQAGLGDSAAEIVSSPFVPSRHLNYRNKTVMHVARLAATGRFVMGYFGEDNRTVVDVPQCPLSLGEINDELREMRASRDFWRWAGAGAKVTLRASSGGRVVVWADRPAARPDPPLPELVEETPILGSMRVPARGFWQTNGETGAALVRAVAELVRHDPPRVFVDLCCGVGVFGLSAAALGAGRVAGLDSGRDVIAAARANARDHGFASKSEFVCGDIASDADRFLSERGGEGEFVLVDPPRAGLDGRVVSALLRHRARTLAYVSCAPDTLARDLRMLCAPGGYRLASARMFGMFPRTAHFETLCVLSRQ